MGLLLPRALNARARATLDEVDLIIAATNPGPAFPADAKGMATRVSSGQVLNAVGKRVPWLMGESGSPSISMMSPSLA